MCNGTLFTVYTISIQRICVDVFPYNDIMTDSTIPTLIERKLMDREPVDDIICIKNSIILGG